MTGVAAADTQRPGPLGQSRKCRAAAPADTEMMAKAGEAKRLRERPAREEPEWLRLMQNTPASGSQTPRAAAAESTAASAARARRRTAAR